MGFNLSYLLGEWARFGSLNYIDFDLLLRHPSLEMGLDLYDFVRICLSALFIN